MQVNNITLNFLDNYIQFYDWLKKDKISINNNLLLLKVSSKMINDLISNQIIISDLSSKKVIFTDEYTYIAIMFDKSGKTQYKSSILLSDEVRLEKKLNKIKYSKYDYKILNQDTLDNELRINKDIKSTILKELNNLKKENNKDKISYLYYEWFSKMEISVDKMLEKMLKRLNMPISQKEKEIFNLINISYKV